MHCGRVHEWERWPPRVDTPVVNQATSGMPQCQSTCPPEKQPHPRSRTGAFLSLGFTSLKTGNQVGSRVYELVRQETRAHRPTPLGPPEGCVHQSLSSHILFLQSSRGHSSAGFAKVLRLLCALMSFLGISLVLLRRLTIFPFFYPFIIHPYIFSSIQT